MESLFSADYKWLWVAAMALALFPFVQKLIWVMTVRKHIRKSDREKVDDAEQQRLKRRAGFTAGLLCFLFSLGYINVLFQS